MHLGIFRHKSIALQAILDRVVDHRWKMGASNGAEAVHTCCSYMVLNEVPWGCLPYLQYIINIPR
jgi:hypothetical protein